MKYNDFESILVVADDPSASRLLIDQSLKRLGYQGVLARDSATAIRMLKTQEFALLLLDLRMQEADAMDLLCNLAKQGISIPSILVTASPAEKIPVEALRLRVQDYLTDLSDEAALKASLERALGEPRLQQEKLNLSLQLKQQVTWLTTLHRVGRSIIVSLDLDEVLSKIVEAGVFLTHAEEGFLALLDDASGQLYLRAEKNIHQDKIKTLHLPVTDTLIGTVIQTGKPIRTNRVQQGSPIKVCTGFLVHGLLHVPIQSHGQTIGVLSMDNFVSTRIFSATDEMMLTSLADYAAIALDNAKLYQQARRENIERAKIEESLRKSDERYALVVKGANDGVWDWDLKTNQLYFSPRWKQIVGCEDEDITNNVQDWFNRVHPEDFEKLKLDLMTHTRGLSTHFENEHRIILNNGSYRWVLSRGIAVIDPEFGAVRMAGSLSDINDRKMAEERLAYGALHDPLTGLANRSLFADHLKYSMERAKQRQEYSYAVILVGVNGFREIADQLGYLGGEQLLIEIGQLLKSGLRTTDILARLGGEEFAILLDDIHQTNTTARIIDWILEHLASPVVIFNKPISFTVSIGVVQANDAHETSEEVLRDAAIALYRARENGKARFEIFESTMREKMVNRLQVENELKQAIESDQLRVYYQPIMSLDNGQIVGFEALCRWQHPERGLLLPADFILIAEETGLIVDLDRWMMKSACGQMQTWLNRLPIDPHTTISVNISSRHMLRPDLVDTVRQVLHKTGLTGHNLKLEITEYAVIENSQETAALFRSLKSLGVQLQIDDFGTGYSSLSYLPQFPVNAIKIDRSFVQKLGENASYVKLVESIIRLSKDFRMSVIAEGVETDAQLAQLRSMGCKYGQGLIISAPLACNAAEALLVSNLNAALVDGQRSKLFLQTRPLLEK